MVLGDKDASSNESFSDKMKVLSKRVFSPPVLASLCGMFAGFISIFRGILTGPLTPALEAIGTLGAAYLPAVLLVLAGSLASTSAVPAAPAAPSSASSGPAVAKKSITSRIIEEAKSNQAFATQVMALYLAKFLLIPSFVFALIKFLQVRFPIVAGWLKNDPALYFVLLIQTCMPSAQNLTVILQLQVESVCVCVCERERERENYCI